MQISRFCVLAVLLLTVTEATAFEADVHFGLTQWLALKAGFDPLMAKIIAIGDNRVDSGDMQFIDLMPMYACAGKDDVGVRRTEEHHYPSAVLAPAPPDARAVLPGSESARKAAKAADAVAPDQAGARLLLLGSALHTLQDSWSHQGVPDVPPPIGGLFACDPTRVWSHPKARGGWNSHDADLTKRWPADTVAMAKATYENLTHYPTADGEKRTPRNWEEIRPALDGFVAASTKTEKRRWFVAQGINDVSFLEGINLPDGAEPFALVWPDRRLPALTSPVSRQHETPQDLLDFYNQFFAKWLAATDFTKLAVEFGIDTKPGVSKRGAFKAMDKAELAARLAVWRLRDHGRIANIAHSLGPLTASERATVNAAAKKPGAIASYAQANEAFFPLLPRGETVSPLLPFFIATTSGAAGYGTAAMAVVKFRHLPYDTIAVLSQRIDGRWRVVSIVGLVDH